MMNSKSKSIVLIALILLLCFVFVLNYAWTRTPVPKLYLQGNIAGMEEKSDIRNISFVYSDGINEYSGFAEIKVQGTSSLQYEKKNYNLKFFEDALLEKPLNIDVGWGAQNKYCVKANWIDRTHARNIVSARLAAKVQAKYNLLMQAPRNGLIDGFPVEIYSNGDFLGLYTFNIPKDKWQFAMDCKNPDHIVIIGEGWEPSNLFQAEADFKTWELEVGEQSEETLQKINRLFDFVMNSSDEEFKANFQDYLNLDSVLNYYVITDLAWMGDNLGKNMLLLTYDGMHWYLSLYDMDTSWGTRYDGVLDYLYESELNNMRFSQLFVRIEEAFSKELAERYFELRDDLLSNEKIMEEFEAFEDEIPKLTFVKEALRWSDGPFHTRKALPGADYDQIEAYLNSVSDRLDAKYAAWLN